MKVFIDANIYLDFYRSNNDALKIFDELLRSVSSIILTDQIVNEFYRNREVVLKTVKAKFITETQIESFSSSYLQGLKEFAELNELKKEYNKKRKKIESIINNCIDDPSVHQIYQHFTSLINSKDAIIYETSKEIMDLAHQRKLKGNPPLYRINIQ